ncbi:CBS domain containing-hemolysin-like protein [Murinocardiopsis flavida]|uniref:CBS domain containing-hemolysin-like protein n=1 Tax=Murinocardiopsis flavida TaxID=645275 RepID=A0A2P8DUP2_9ACTN|nr:hemolysin family protein [Murinocardiopsis flavida]PSL00943.1 CBS domain containing-hemolysin-like protein [Murinocardiopsis flavida]
MIDAVTGREALELSAAFGFAVLLSLLAAFFVSAEVALARASRMGVSELVGSDRRGVRQLEIIAADPARHLNMVLLLRVVCEVLATLALAVGFIDWLGLGWVAVTASAVLMVLVNYVLIGVTPRILGRQFPAAVALVGASVVHPITLVLGPLAQLLVWLGRAFTPRGIGDREGPFASEDELRHMVDLAERGHVIDAEERQMIHSVFKLDDTSVREVMVPRPDIVFIDHDDDVDGALALALRSGFSRIPVAGENEDDVVGIVYLKDVVARLRDTWAGRSEAESEGAAADGSRTVRDIMRDATYVPDSKPIDELLREMQQQRIHVAVVIDEYGGTAGLVTIEDIVEEIVGEITDEYDDEVPPIERLGEDKARVTARLPLGELAELFDVELDADDVETVGGLLAYVLGRVPLTGSEVEFSGLRLTAEDPSGRRNQTATVLVERMPAGDPPGAAEQP